MIDLTKSPEQIAEELTQYFEHHTRGESVNEVLWRSHNCAIKCLEAALSVCPKEYFGHSGHQLNPDYTKLSKALEILKSKI